MTKNICFVGNFYKTVVYEAIAQILEKHNIMSYWIIPNPRQYELYRKKYGNDRVLLIDQTIITNNPHELGDFKMNEIIYGDRIWKYDLERGKRYLKSIQKPISDYIMKNHIHTVFGENTTAEELLICRMCNQIRNMNCKFFSLMTARIPSDRFLFFIDEKQTEVWKRKKQDVDVQVNLEIKKPSYFALNDDLLRKTMSISGVANRLKHFITDENIDSTDPDVLTNKKARFIVKSKEVVNQQLYRFVSRVDLEVIKGKKYVFYGFHKQPESSIDVCGRYMEDQSQVIQNLWRQLPTDWVLIIKEHSNAVGDRSLGYFNKLKQLPGVILLKENIDSKVIIEKAQLVVTNTGTMALEAALMGIPAITLSKVVFNCLNYCQHFSWEDFEKYHNLEEVVDYIKALPQNIEDYRNLVAQHSFEGTMGDIYGTPTFLENTGNINKLAVAFKEVVDRDED